MKNKLPFIKARVFIGIILCIIILLVYDHFFVSHPPPIDKLRSAIAEFYIGRVIYSGRYIVKGDVFKNLIQIEQIGNYNKELQYWPVMARLDLESDEAEIFPYSGEIVRLKTMVMLMNTLASAKSFELYLDESGNWKARFSSDGK